MADRRDENVYAERDRLMDINTATVRELCTIPGIDEKRARDIVSLRTRRGRFDSIDDLRSIEGFSDKVVDSAREHLAVKRRKG